MASTFALHQALATAVEYITGVIPESECSDEEKAMVARFVALIDHRKNEKGGQCPYCGHFGDDCTGSKPTAVELFREAVNHQLRMFEKLSAIRTALGCDPDELPDLVEAFAVGCPTDQASDINEDNIVQALAGLCPESSDSTE